MPTDLLDDVAVAAKTAQAALVKTVREDHRRAKSLVGGALRSVQKTNAKTARRAGEMMASVGGEAEHRYLDFRAMLHDRPLAALGIGAGIGLGLGLLLWTGYEIEREPSAS